MDYVLQKCKTYITCDSHVVPHRSTEQAQGCLTSEFGWDPVLSPWYERMMVTGLAHPRETMNHESWLPVQQKGTTGFEPVTRGSAIHCSATELCTRVI